MEPGNTMPGHAHSLHTHHLSPLSADVAKAVAATSPWHRMKWTDGMIRLLIMVVYYMADDGDAAKSKKASAPAPLKKGKWKSVSKAMMEKGYNVSPQQCEDKFNDLNKRYKRVNELLGKGIACRVVENQTLLDSMHHLAPKAKDEVRKLLTSKHLFFREMCAYHNGAVKGVAEVDEEKDVTDEYVYSEEEDGDDGSDDEEKDVTSSSSCMQELKVEMEGVAGRGEMREWVKRKAEELEEKRVGYQSEALRIDQQRFKWLRFSGNKEREMKEMRFENERRRIENERMLLLLKRKEFELCTKNGGGGDEKGSNAGEQPWLVPL